MGIYERDYYRPQRPAFSVGGPRTAIGYLLLVNVVVWLADSLFLGGRLTRLLSVSGATLTTPYLWWQFVTYAFIHATEPSHIILNMFGLWMFGRDVEEVYGTKEFLRIYLATAFVGSLVWSLGNFAVRGPLDKLLFGASGAVAGIVILYALQFPRRIILLFFVLPVYAWVLGILIVTLDAYGALFSRVDDPNKPQIAYVVHLAGAGFAFVYFRMGWNFGRLVPNRFSLKWLRMRPRLRLHRPADDEEGLNAEVDRILAKIAREGETSLTRQERKTLISASREFQRRRRDEGDS